MCEASDAVGVLPAKVRDVVYAGNLCDVFLNVGEFKVRAQVHPNQIEGFAPGDDVSAVFDARSVWPVTKDTVSEDAGDEAADDESRSCPNLTWRAVWRPQSCERKSSCTSGR